MTAHSTGGTAALTLVLIEDNPDDVELMLATLNEFRLRNPVVVLRDGQEAVDYLFCRGAYAGRAMVQPDVILLDLKLPKVGGLEILRLLKNDPHLRRVPVVVLTSSREEADVVAGYELGANSYIVKPVDFDQLSETVRSIGSYWLIVNEQLPD